MIMHSHSVKKIIIRMLILSLHLAVTFNTCHCRYLEYDAGKNIFYILKRVRISECLNRHCSGEQYSIKLVEILNQNQFLNKFRARNSEKMFSNNYDYFLPYKTIFLYTFTSNSSKQSESTFDFDFLKHMSDKNLILLIHDMEATSKPTQCEHIRICEVIGKVGRRLQEKFNGRRSTNRFIEKHRLHRNATQEYFYSYSQLCKPRSKEIIKCNLSIIMVLHGLCVDYHSMRESLNNLTLRKKLLHKFPGISSNFNNFQRADKKKYISLNTCHLCYYIQHLRRKYSRIWITHPGRVKQAQCVHTTIKLIHLSKMLHQPKNLATCIRLNSSLINCFKSLGKRNVIISLSVRLVFSSDVLPPHANRNLISIQLISSNLFKFSSRNLFRRLRSEEREDYKIFNNVYLEIPKHKPFPNFGGDEKNLSIPKSRNKFADELHDFSRSRLQIKTSENWILKIFRRLRWLGKNIPESGMKIKGLICDYCREITLPISSPVFPFLKFYYYDVDDLMLKFRHFVNLYMPKSSHNAKLKWNKVFMERKGISSLFKNAKEVILCNENDEKDFEMIVSYVDAQHGCFIYCSLFFHYFRTTSPVAAVTLNGFKWEISKVPKFCHKYCLTTNNIIDFRQWFISPKNFPQRKFLKSKKIFLKNMKWGTFIDQGGRDASYLPIWPGLTFNSSAKKEKIISLSIQVSKSPSSRNFLILSQLFTLLLRNRKETILLFGFKKRLDDECFCLTVGKETNKDCLITVRPTNFAFKKFNRLKCTYNVEFSRWDITTGNKLNNSYSKSKHHSKILKMIKKILLWSCTPPRRHVFKIIGLPPPADFSTHCNLHKLDSSNKYHRKNVMMGVRCTNFFHLNLFKFQEKNLRRNIFTGSNFSHPSNKVEATSGSKKRDPRNVFGNNQPPSVDLFQKAGTKTPLRKQKYHHRRFCIEDELIPERENLGPFSSSFLVSKGIFLYLKSGEKRAERRAYLIAEKRREKVAAKEKMKKKKIDNFGKKTKKCLTRESRCMKKWEKMHLKILFLTENEEGDDSSSLLPFYSFTSLLAQERLKSLLAKGGLKQSAHTFGVTSGTNSTYQKREKRNSGKSRRFFLPAIPFDEKNSFSYLNSKPKTRERRVNSFVFNSSISGIYSSLVTSGRKRVGLSDEIDKEGRLTKNHLNSILSNKNNRSKFVLDDRKEDLLLKTSCKSLFCLSDPIIMQFSQGKEAGWNKLKEKSNRQQNIFTLHKSNSSLKLTSFVNIGQNDKERENTNDIHPPSLSSPFFEKGIKHSAEYLPQVSDSISFLEKYPRYMHGTRAKRNVLANTSIPILGLFDLTCEPGQHSGGYSEKAAAQLAIKHINEMQIIPGHRLVMFVNDTRCDTGAAVDAFFHAIYTQKVRLLLLLGAACPDVTESLAQVTPYWNLVQIAFGSETPALSDRSSFPLFFRTVAPDSSHNAARVALLKYLKWHTVATLSESNNLYTLALNELVLPLESANISLIATVTMDAQDNIGEHLKTLKERDCRIFIGSFSPPLTRLLFCQIYHLKMYGRDYAWLLSGSSQNRWWMETKDVNCSRAQMLQAAQGSFLITAYSFSVGNQTSISGMTSRDFVKVFARTGYPLTKYVTHTYDAVWAGALALKKIVDRLNMKEYAEPLPTRNPNWGHWAVKKMQSQHSKTFVERFSSKYLVQNPSMEQQTQSDEGYSLIKEAEEAGKSAGTAGLFETGTVPVKPENMISFGRHRKSTELKSDYRNSKITSELLFELQRLQFYGVSGSVSFEQTDRIGVTAFYQVQDGETKMVALYYPRAKYLDFKCPRCSSVVWPGGQVPIASRVFMTRVVTINPLAFIVMSSLACLGIILAVFFLGFNLTYRRLKFIKMSSPHLNNITVVGCIFVYTAVLLLGLDYATLSSSEALPIVCTGRAFLLSAGFSLSFGSMFTKTYRVHQIFTRSNSAGLVRNKLLQDTQLISLVVVLLIADVMLVSTWAAVDPMRRELLNLTLEISPLERGVVYQPQIEVCRSIYQKEWLGSLYVYKGLLVTVGAYMAWETRHVKIQALNDSQYIGMSVYNVVITSVIVITTAYIIREKITLSYVIVTTLIISSTTTTLCLLFIPKILALSRHTDVDPVIESMGLRMQSKTRRLVMDDKREQFHRAEIRNKVYKRELLQLDAQITPLVRKLEYLENPTGSPPPSPVTFLPKGGTQADSSSVCVQMDSNSLEEQERYHNFNKVIKRASKTNYLQGDDAVIRRAKRALQMRLLHRSLPSLMTPLRFPGLGADLKDLAPKCCAENSFSLSSGISGEDRPIPPSPHPLQRARVQRRCPSESLSNTEQESEEKHSFRLDILPMAEKSQGILDLTYTLNFSTPHLNELSFNVGTKTTSKPRVSFSDVPITYSPSEFPSLDSESAFPSYVSPSSPSYSSSSSSLNLAMLPPYPSSSVSCLEKSTEHCESIFSVLKPPANFSCSTASSKSQLKLPSKERSSSQPSIASTFCSFLKNKTKTKKPEGASDPNSLSCQPLLSVTRSSSLLTIPSPLTDTNLEGNQQKDLRLSFDCPSEREVVPSAYRVNDFEILCPMTFQRGGMLSPKYPSTSSTSTGVDKSSKFKKNLKTILSSPKNVRRKYSLSN